MDIIIIWKT